MASEMPRPVAAVIFDLDGVLINSEPHHLQAAYAALATFGVDAPEGFFDAFIGKTDGVLFSHAAKVFGLQQDCAALVAAKHAAYEAAFDQVKPMPGVLPLLDALRDASLPLALATSATAENQQMAFKEFGLAPYFRAVVTSADVTHTKPHPEPYQRAAQKLGLAPAACYVMEDSLNGIRSAARAGCTPIGFTSSFPAQDLLEAGAVATVDRLLDALALILPSPSREP